MTADFTVRIVERESDTLITLRGNQTGTELSTTCGRNLLLVLFAIGRLWLDGARVVCGASPLDPQSVVHKPSLP